MANTIELSPEGMSFAQLETLANSVAKVIRNAEHNGLPVPEELSESMDLIRAYMHASLDAIIEDTVGCLSIDECSVPITEDTLVWDANPGVAGDLSRVQVFIPGEVYADEAADRALGLLRAILERMGIGFDEHNKYMLRVSLGERWAFHPCEHPDHEWHPVPADMAAEGASIVTRVTIEPA